jgi:phage gpG-like protein
MVGDVPILTFTGALRDSLTGGSGWVEEMDDRNVTFGTSIPYAKFHQTGYYVSTKKGMRWVPKRPPIELTPMQKERWNNIFMGYVREGIDRKKAVKYNLT